MHDQKQTGVPEQPAIAGSLSFGAESVSGPRADADWSQATVKVTLPVHSTAMTIPTEVELTLAQLAALLEAHGGQ